MKKQVWNKYVYEVLIDTYESHEFKWSDLSRFKEIKPDDIIVEFKIDKKSSLSWGGEDEIISYFKQIIVKRSEKETDDQYYERLRSEELLKRNKEKEEKELYLRLKAKYE